MSGSASLDVAVTVGATSVRLQSDCVTARPWLEEMLGAWVTGDGSSAEGGWTIRVSDDPLWLADLRARRGEHGEPRPCFAQDTLVVSLPARTDDSGSIVLADDEREAFLVVRPGQVDLVLDDERRRGRILVVWTLAEIAAIEGGAGVLDLHGSAIATDAGAIAALGPKGSGKTTLLLHLAAGGGRRLLANDRVIAAPDGAGWSLHGMPAPMRIRPESLAGLPVLPPWANSLERPYLHSLGEAGRAPAAPAAPPTDEGVHLGLAQVVDWLGSGLGACSPLAVFLFPEIHREADGWSVEPLPPDEVERRLLAHRFGISLKSRGPTLFESLRGGRSPEPQDLARRVAKSVPGFSLRLGRDAHLEPEFATSLLRRLPSSPDAGASRGGVDADAVESESVAAIEPVEIESIRHALGEAPEAAYTTPLVYPWSVQHFDRAPRAPRPRIGTGPFRLYVHVPFCRYHCSFCFYSVRTGAGEEEKARYVEAVIRELEQVEPGTPISQLFVGGGTPTALSPRDLSRMLGAIFDRAPGAPGRVHTIEASPDSLGPGHLDVLLEHGVRRVSMGIESLDESVLDAVHRRHSAAQALAACRLVLDRGLTLNVDLIYGLPGQSMEGFRRDLERAATAGASSLCLYALRLNAHTAVANVVGTGERFDLERLVRWRRFVFRAAEEAGFVRTRPYFFERAGRTSLPSQSPDEPLLGIGMSARSQIGDAVFRNLDRSAGYVDRIEAGESPVETVFRLGEGDRQALFVAGTLGNGRALRREAWARRFGRAIEDDHGERLAALREGGLLVDDGEAFRLSEGGMAVYDRILLGFYPEARQSALRSLPPPRPPRTTSATRP